jgi:hypothetical protein
MIMKKIIAVLLFTGFLFAQDATPPAVPANVKAFGYEKHVDVTWYNNTEADLAGYKVYRKTGGQYYLYNTIPKEKSYAILIIGSTGLTYTLKVSAYDLSGNESPLSDSVMATTHEMNDDEFLDMVQRATFRYFWDYAHPVSGLARERLGSGDIVTTGGSGFGIMALITGIERDFTSRDLGAARMLKILEFLTSKAQRYHGVFSHWLNGNTGATIPFSTKDNGGDLVETSFMIQGLLAARQYFNSEDTTEIRIRELITKIWEEVEWSWYLRSPYSTTLYWHWSPDYQWEMNFPLRGYNETMITYLLAIASPTFGIPPDLYYKGWASASGYFVNQTYYGYKLWVGDPLGGPLFFAHYSFLGFDPRGIRDKYCNYFINNKHHTLINREYAIANPKGFEGYGPDTWGLTASDNPWGYLAHEPGSNDNGTIASTAALSSMPYTPEESLSALKNFYRTFYSGLWGEYGFKDAFNLSQDEWFADSYLAIDQGPIIVMIENHRTGLLWENFMRNPEIKPMLDSIGFVPDSVTGIKINNILGEEEFRLLGNYPNPFNPSTNIVFNLQEVSNVEISIFNPVGQKVKSFFKEMPAGENKILWDGRNDYNSELSSGIYIYKVKSGNKILSGKLVLQR